MIRTQHQKKFMRSADSNMMDLGSVCLSIADGDHQAPPKSDGGIPFITISALVNGRVAIDLATRYVPSSYIEALPKQRLPKCGDILFSVTGSIGKVGIVESGQFVFQRHIALLKPSRIIKSQFLFHMMRSPQVLKQAHQVATGTAQLTVSISGLRKINIPLFSLNAQRKIACRIDRLSTVSKRARAELDRVQALNDTLIAAKLNSAYLAAARSAPLVKIGDIIEECRYGTAIKCHTESSGIPVLRIPNISGGIICTENLKYGHLSAGEAQKLALRVGDVLLIRSNGSPELVGVAAEVGPNSAGMAFAGYLIRIRTKKSELNPSFLTQMLRAPQIRSKIEMLAKSTSGVHNINSSEIAAIKIPLPSISEQLKIVSGVERAFNAIDRFAVEVRSARNALDKLDQSILAKAFRGELVPQDPNDEPASVLFERIQAERAADGPAPKRGRRPRTAAGA